MNSTAQDTAMRCDGCGTDVSRWWVDVEGMGYNTRCSSCAGAERIRAHYPCSHGRVRYYDSRLETGRKAVTTVVAAAFDRGFLELEGEYSGGEDYPPVVFLISEHSPGVWQEAGLFMIPDAGGRAWSWWQETADTVLLIF